jgi:hypothetical protein
MRDALGEITRRAQELVQLEAKDVVIDIGANDGTLLRSYTNTDLDLIGFDPARNLSQDGEPFTRVIDFFTAAAFKRVRGESVRAKIVTSIAMFYDLEDPLAFMSDIKEVLHPDGIWIVQFADLPGMLLTNMYDNICHEHIAYYHLSPFERLLEQAGLRLVDIELNDVNGSSYRLYVRHRYGPASTPEGVARLQAQRTLEFNLKLDEAEPYNRFTENVVSSRYSLRYLLQFLKKEGKKVIGYGASTKGNVILQYCELTSDLVSCIADRNPRKHGASTLGSNIPIVSEEYARTLNPDYFLVLPYHFLPEMLIREQDFISRGGRFIVPVPTVQLFP